MGRQPIFLHHDLVPAFYNLEMRTLPMDGRKDRSKTVSSEMMWKLFDASKRAAYRDTVFLARTEHAADVRRVLTSADHCPRALVTYTCQNKLSDCNERRLLTRSRVRPLDASGGKFAVVSEFCGSSISRVFDLIVRLRYRTISLVGVELNSQHHFYTSLPNYAEVAQRLPVQWERSMLAFVRRANRNTTLHATATRGIQHYIDALGHFYAGRLSALQPVAREPAAHRQARGDGVASGPSGRGRQRGRGPRRVVVAASAARSTRGWRRRRRRRHSACKTAAIVSPIVSHATPLI